MPVTSNQALFPAQPSARYTCYTVSSVAKKLKLNLELLPLMSITFLIATVITTFSVCAASGQAMKQRPKNKVLISSKSKMVLLKTEKSDPS